MLVIWVRVLTTQITQHHKAMSFLGSESLLRRQLKVCVCVELPASPLHKVQEIQKSPTQGFSVGLCDDSNIYEWEVMVIGPDETLYEGGFFKARLSFPKVSC